MEIDARPVRIVASSLRISSMALSILLRTAPTSSLIAIVASLHGLSLINQGPDLFSFDDAPDVAFGVHVKHDYRHLIIFAERNRGAIHHPESLRQDVHIRNL